MFGKDQKQSSALSCDSSYYCYDLPFIFLKKNVLAFYVLFYPSILPFPVPNLKVKDQCQFITLVEKMVDSDI